jgi:hypothetical protein
LLFDLVHRALFRLQLHIAGIRLGLAIGLRGGVLAVETGGRRWLVVIGRVD